MWRLIFIFLTYALFAFQSTDAHGREVTELTYCYENKPVLPHFYGEGPTVPKQSPGPAIEILKHLESISENVRFNFIRLPWKRCLAAIEIGKVDAIVGRYHRLREFIAKYPKDSTGELDYNRKFSGSASCLIYPLGTNLKWNGFELELKEKLTMSVPSGYSIIDDMHKRGFAIYEASSVEKSHELLFKQRVDVSLTDCQMKSIPEGFVENPLPIKESVGYLMFSKQFYQRASGVAEQLWNNLATFNKEAYYQKYEQQE